MSAGWQCNQSGMGEPDVSVFGDKSMDAVGAVNAAAAHFLMVDAALCAAVQPVGVSGDCTSEPSDVVLGGPPGILSVNEPDTSVSAHKKSLLSEMVSRDVWELSEPVMYFDLQSCTYTQKQSMVAAAAEQ